MRALEFITGHVIYNPAYTYKLQLKTTIVMMMSTMTMTMMNMGMNMEMNMEMSMKITLKLLTSLDPGGEAPQDSGLTPRDAKSGFGVGLGAVVGVVVVIQK